MSEQKLRSQVIKKRIVKSILWIILTPLLLLALTIGLIQLKPVQKYLVDRLTKYATEGTGYTTTVDYVNIRWFNSVVFDGTTIYDRDSTKMVSIDELVLSFNLRALVGKKDVQLNEAWLKGASVNLRKADSVNLNIDEWVYNIGKLSASNTPASSESGTFGINKITLLNSEFSLSNNARDSVKTGFDGNHFKINDLNADLLNLLVVQDTFQLDVKYLTAQDEKTGLKIKDLKTFFRVSQKGMAFYDLDLKTDKSHIKDSVVFRHEKAYHMGYFVDSVDVSAGLNKSIIHTDELALFAPELKDIHEKVELTGYFNGRVGSFYADNFSLKFKDFTKLQGRLEMDGLPNIRETLFSVELNNSSIKTSDLKAYIPEKTARITEKLGFVKLKGRFDGFINDFVADGDFVTDLGNFNSNTNLEIDSLGLATYEGQLSTDNFDLGYFTGDSIFQRINMSGGIKGSGFTIENANFSLDANISKVGINNYEYQNIVTDGQFAQSFFSGDFEVNDENFELKANGSVDLRNQKNEFRIEGRIEDANLDELNISSDDITIASDFKLDFVGLKLDNFDGELDLNETYLRYKEQELLTDSLFFSAKRANGQRKVQFHSNHFKIDMEGKFEFTSLLDEIKNVNKDYKRIFSNRSDDAAIVLDPLRNSEPFNLSYQVELPEITPIIHLFDTTIQVSPNATLAGSFSNNGTENFTLNARFDSLEYQNILFLQNEVDINANDLRSRSNMLTLGYLYSARQVYANQAKTEALTLEAVWDGQHIDVRQNLGQESSGNYAEIGANIDLYDDRTEMVFDRSNLIALNQTWNISEDNLLIFKDGRIDVSDLKIQNDDQSINLEGDISISKDTAKTLDIVFKEVAVENINSLTGQDYTGKINGQLKVQSLLRDPFMFGEIDVKELKVDKFLVGDVDGSLTWNSRRKLFNLDFLVNRRDTRIIELKGNFEPSSNTNQLDLALKLDETNLNIAEPYIEDYFTEIGGTISGDMTIKGLLNSPVLSGTGRLNNGQMKINYLNTKYGFNGELTSEKDRINLSALNFLDENQSPLSMSGVIRHNSFKNFTFDLNGDMQNLKVLNTTAELGEPYYGEAFASGTLGLKGEANNLSIAANVTTQPNTKIYIPIGSSEESRDANFIKFVDRTADTTDVATTAKIEEVNKVQLEGLSLDLDIGVTPDAYAEIITDPQTGDIIRGRGNGQLRLQIDTQGDFNMSGDFQITEGAYNFSLFNIITKEFQIEQPSRISWYGDPYSGIMDINASYSQSTSLTPLLSDASVSEGTGADVGRRFPTKVLLKLDGELLSPNINFDIDFSEINTQDFQFQTAINVFKNKISNDEQELNRQVISLIALNRFSEQGNLNIGGKSATQNVSQLLSNQLSQFIAQLDDNLEVDLDLTDLTQEALSTFQLRLSYTFFNGRLRVTREGGLANRVDVNNVAGDWTAEYLLTPDGKYKVKVYSRTNYDLAIAALQSTSGTVSRGASITQTTSFNSLKEFFSGIGKRRKEKQKTQNAKNSDSDSKSGSN